MDTKIKFVSGILTVAILFTFFFVACDKMQDEPGLPTVTEPSDAETTNISYSTEYSGDTTETERVTAGTIIITIPPVTVSESETTETEAETTGAGSTSESKTTPKTTSGGSDTTMTTATPPTKTTSNGIDSFFDDGVFVGNSIMLGFSSFAKKMRSTSGMEGYLGTSKFFCGGSFGVYNNKHPISSDSTHPEYQGKKYTVQDAVGVMGAKTVYLNLMGLNDLAMYGDPDNCSEKCAADMADLCNDIHSRYPDVKIVIISATYLTKERNNMKSLNNKNLSLLNQALLKYCNEKGYDFVDIATPLLDKNGCLAEEYCSDGYCHISRKGYDMWTATLRSYAKAKSEGTYSNPSSMKILSVNG